MMHFAYPTRYPLQPGAQVSIVLTPIRVGDGLAIEYPNKRKGSGRVLRAEANSLEIVAGKNRWRLVPLGSNEAVEVPTSSGQKPVPVWVVQPN